MTDREAFKVGFLMQCAAECLTEAQTKARIKQASTMLKMAGPGNPAAAAARYILPPVATLLGSGMQSATTLGSSFLQNILAPTMARVAVPLMLAPPALGLGAAYLAARAQDDNYDPKAAQRDEEIAEYRRAIDQLQRAKRQRQASLK